MRQDGSIPDFEVLEVESAISGNYDLVNIFFFFSFYPHIICVLLLFRMVSFHRNIARKEFARVQTASVSVQNVLLVIIQCYHNHSCYKITPYTVYVQYTCNSSDYSIKYEIL